MGSDRKRVYELSKEYKISSNAMLVILKDLGFKPKSHMSVATGTMMTAVKEKFAKEKQQVKKEMESKESKKKRF